MSIIVEKKKSLIRWGTALVFALFFIAVTLDLYERYKYMLTAHISIWNPSFFLVVPFLFSVIGITIIAYKKPLWLDILRRYRGHLGWARWLIVILVSANISWYFLYSKWHEIFSGTFAKLFLYLVAAVFISWVVNDQDDKHFSWTNSLAALLLLSSIFWTASNFQYVKDYPFPFYWSEGNRFWDYSIMYGRDLYNYPPELPLPVYIDAGRQSLWGLIFLLPNVSIAGMRLWSALVFTIPYAILSLFIFNPRKGKFRLWLLISLWVMIFLGQGPIYTPLIFAAILTTAGTKNRMPLLIGLLLVGLAGYYTYRSRSTWIFAPAIWAAMVTLVTANPPKNLRKIRELVGFLWKPAALAFAGIAGSYLIPTMIPQIIDRIKNVETSAGLMSVEGMQATLNRQPLLWERLLPNPTYAPGILLGLLIGTAPVIILLIAFGKEQAWFKRLNFLQTTAILGALLAFLLVGIVVSVKIGGGSNLHNMDMFLICLVFVAGLAWHAGADEWFVKLDQRPQWVPWILIAAIFLPLAPFIMQITPVGLPPEEIIKDALATVESKVNIEKQHGDVLFLDHRQLLTFGYIKKVPLIAEYEKKRMMDEAMADNGEYFEAFIDDMINQRFSLIVSEMLSVKWQGDTYHFGNENDAWVLWVSIPILCYYEPVDTFSDVGLQLLKPRTTVLNDKNIICPEPGEPYPP
jgi:hypothetical protein